MSDKNLINALENVGDALTALNDNHSESLDGKYWYLLLQAWNPFELQLAAECESLRFEEQANLDKWNEREVTK